MHNMYLDLKLFPNYPQATAFPEVEYEQLITQVAGIVNACSYRHLVSGRFKNLS